MSRNTYIIDISDLDKTWNNFEKRTKHEIKKCPYDVWYCCGDLDLLHGLEDFDKRHRETRPDRKINKKFIYDTWKKRKPNIREYCCGNSSAIISWDKDTGYYLLAARNKHYETMGEPSKILWEAMKDLNALGIKKFDLCGCNVPSISLFKRGFGGKNVLQKIPCLEY